MSTKSFSLRNSLLHTPQHTHSLRIFWSFIRIQHPSYHFLFALISNLPFFFLFTLGATVVSCYPEYGRNLYLSSNTKTNSQIFTCKINLYSETLVNFFVLFTLQFFNFPRQNFPNTKSNSFSIFYFSYLQKNLFAWNYIKDWLNSTLLSSTLIHQAQLSDIADLAISAIWYECICTAYPSNLEFHRFRGRSHAQSKYAISHNWQHSVSHRYRAHLRGNSNL